MHGCTGECPRALNGAEGFGVFEVLFEWGDMEMWCFGRAWAQFHATRPKRPTAHPPRFCSFRDVSRVWPLAKTWQKPGREVV